jgi:hypothetical protein
MVRYFPDFFSVFLDIYNGNNCNYFHCKYLKKQKRNRENI